MNDVAYLLIMHCVNPQQTVCDSLFNHFVLGVMMTPKH